MISQRQLFLQYLAQTNDFPLMVEIDRAKGIYIFDKKGKKYIDIISGISVCNLGHCHPAIVKAIKTQAGKYLHTMVYGEYIQSPQVELAKYIADLTPGTLNTVYLVNSGSEANEGAVKLAKRYTGRFEVVAFKNAYHGSTQGALSLMGNENFKNPFRPLLPGIKFIDFNNEQGLEAITEKTACVIVEPVQGEAGIIIPENDFLKKLAKKCKENGSLLIFDEVQTAFGRTGELFAFKKFGVIPDILTLAKGMGGGMPIGAFISSKNMMKTLSVNPALGHITTFGGHPVSAAAALANIKTIVNEGLIKSVNEKGELFKDLLKHEKIKQVRSIGLMMAAQFENFALVNKIIRKAKDFGVLTDWFLFCDSAIRIAPPLIITETEIRQACKLLLKAINEV